MRIGIDCYEANAIQRVGVGRYAFELLHALYRNDLTNHYTLFVPNRVAADLPKEREKWNYRVVTSSRLWTLVGLPNAVRKEKLDVFFSPTHYVPFFSRIPRAFSIMDLSYSYFPQLFRLSDLVKLRIGTWFSVHVAQKIFTISEFSKNDIIHTYKVPSERISVTYPGFDMNTFNPQIRSDLVEKAKKKYNVKDYILFVGTLQPRKNIVRLIRAFDMLKNRKLKLLVIGKKGWIYNTIFEKIRELQLGERILFTDFVKNSELAYLLKGARCLVLPSLYEGFGIPAVEALACGTPAVVSDVSSLPEIVGEAGILVDPYQSESIARGIEKVLNLSSKEKNTLVKKGLAQSARFRWDTCAQKTLAGLKEVIP